MTTTSLSLLTLADNRYFQALDPIHQDMTFFEEPISVDVWRDKYAWKTDTQISDMSKRVAIAVNGNDGEEHIQEAFFAIEAGLWIPAGRILAGAGTEKRVTLLNCYVNATLEDSMDSIMNGISNIALTMQQGGGMGTDYSPLRPEGAILYRTHSKASGPLPFIDVADSTSRTIRSAGDRRGAMMTTLVDTHPDLPKFIVAKRQKGKWTETNVSVLVSDALMEAVRDDEEWVLHFSIPPMSRDSSLTEYDFIDDNQVQQYAYSVWRARDLWELITRNTFEWSEPGIIFIDRVNNLNNLQHVEQIRCTNPCGEQPLPPHGACDLGHVNLARLVKNPFTDKAVFDWKLLRKIVAIGHRFLDNVLDVSGYPLEEQRLEAIHKRRIGIGFTGLADALAFMRYRYGSPRAIEFAENITREICLASYSTNVDLAIEKGTCPAFDTSMTEGTTFIAQRLPQELKDRIRNHGLRNGVALTVAPTGTTSVVFGNLSGSGCEPIFAHEVDRQVRQSVEGKPDEYRQYKNVRGYAERVWRKLNGEDIEYPAYMVTAQELGVEEHITMQAAVQRWVDASVSKTVNCPTDMTYEEFVKVYDLAYQLGCKGCTTYKPSDVRGSILSVSGVSNNSIPENLVAEKEAIFKRPEALQGCTYQIKWPRRDAALYLTLNHDEDGRPVEMLMASKDSSNFEWVTALTLMVTAIFKKGGDVSFVADELKQIQSYHDFAWMEGKHFGSLPAYIGHILERHFNGALSNGNVQLQSPQAYASAYSAADVVAANLTRDLHQHAGGDLCPSCKSPSVYRMEGCKKCSNCGWSSC